MNICKGSNLDMQKTLDHVDLTTKLFIAMYVGSLTRMLAEFCEA